MVRALVWACAAALCAACTAAPPVPAARPAGAQAAPAALPAGGALGNFATITVSPSTNTPGIVVIVRMDGKAVWETKPYAGRGVRYCGGDQGEVAIDPLAKTLLGDIPSDVRLADLPVTSCAKPASFRTTTTLEHFGDKSGDLSCPQTDPRATKLAQDVDAVMKAVLAACK